MKFIGEKPGDNSIMPIYNNIFSGYPCCFHNHFINAGINKIKPKEMGN